MNGSRWWLLQHSRSDLTMQTNKVTLIQRLLRLSYETWIETGSLSAWYCQLNSHRETLSLKTFPSLMTRPESLTEINQRQKQEYQEYVFTPLYRIIALSLDLSEWLQKPISSPVLLLVMAGGQNINIKERKIVHVVVERLSFLKIKILGILLGIFGWIWDHLKHLGNWAWKSPQNIVCPTLFPV